MTCHICAKTNCIGECEPKIQLDDIDVVDMPAQQEPVAWAFLNGQYAHIVWGKQRPDDEIHTIPLYTSPPTLSLAQRQARSADTWVGLTEPEINDCYESIMFDQNIEPSRMGVYLEIEAKLKEKNT